MKKIRTMLLAILSVIIMLVASSASEVTGKENETIVWVAVVLMVVTYLIGKSWYEKGKLSDEVYDPKNDRA